MKKLPRFVPKVIPGDKVIMQKDGDKLWTVCKPPKWTPCYDFSRHNRYYFLRRGAKLVAVRGDRICAMKNGTFVSSARLRLEPK